jgi:hypothetical protein
MEKVFLKWLKRSLNYDPKLLKTITKTVNLKALKVINFIHIAGVGSGKT